MIMTKIVMMIIMTKNKIMIITIMMMQVSQLMRGSADIFQVMEIVIVK